MMSSDYLLDLAREVQASAREATSGNPIEKLIAIHNYASARGVKGQAQEAVERSREVEDIKRAAIKKAAQSIGLCTRLASNVGRIIKNGGLADLEKAINYVRSVKVSVAPIDAACVEPFICDIESARNRLLDDECGEHGEELERFVKKNMLLANAAYRTLRQSELNTTYSGRV